MIHIFVGAYIKHMVNHEHQWKFATCAVASLCICCCSGPEAIATEVAWPWQFSLEPGVL